MHARYDKVEGPDLLEAIDRMEKVFFRKWWPKGKIKEVSRESIKQKNKQK
jgi:hypothetical protein